MPAIIVPGEWYYPMYDFAHPLEDAREYYPFSLLYRISDHNELYEWFRQCGLSGPGIIGRPKQIEFIALT